MMKKWAVCVLTLFLICFANAGWAEGFDLSIFEDPESRYSRLLEVSHEDSDVFIYPNIEASQEAFSHKFDSEFYYSTFTPDILVLDHQTEDETALFRLWIKYHSEACALYADTAKITIGNTRYIFKLSKPNVTMYDDTFSESIVLLIGDGIRKDFMLAWHDAYKRQDPISVELTGPGESLAFTVPEMALTTVLTTYSSYLDAGGSKQPEKGTPCRIETICTPKFNVDLFEDPDGEFSRMFDVYRGDHGINIECKEDVAGDRRSMFRMPEDTPVLAGSLLPSILIWEPGTDHECASPVLSFKLVTQKDGFHTDTVSITVKDTIYTYTVTNQNAETVDDELRIENFSLFFDLEGAQFMPDLYDAAVANEKVPVCLSGAAGEIRFDMPEPIVAAFAVMSSAFLEAGGFETIDNMPGNPVTITKK